jgi:ornithine carbamoyltransferase
LDRSALTGKDYISTADWSIEEINVALDVSHELKAAFREGTPHRLLPDKTLFMIFLDLSTRTRNAFEAGMTQLGGHAHFVDANTSQIAHGESPRDMGIILSSYGHGIAIRHDKVPGEGNAYMREVAAHAEAPVINLQCDIDHPTQQLADLMTIEEVFGTRDLSGLRVCVSWAYAPSYAKPMSVPQGLALLLPRFGADLVIARPPEFRLMEPVMEHARRLASAGGGSIVEIGSFKGRSTICLARGSKAGRNVRIYAIDPHRGTAYEDFKRNLAVTDIEDIVTHVRRPSQEALPAIGDQPIELLFIDGNHKYPMVLEDFEQYVPRVVDGGVVAMHDTIKAYPGSKRVAEDRIYRSRQFREVRFVFSTMTVGRKVARNTLADRLRARRALYTKNLFELLLPIRDRIPAPLERLGRRVLR